MKEFLHRVFSDVKNKKMTKQDAIGILRDYDMRMGLRQSASLHPLAQQSIFPMKRDRDSRRLSAAGNFFSLMFLYSVKKLMPGELLLEMARGCGCFDSKGD